MNTIKTLPQFLHIAFSGGIDSVVLTHLALSKGVKVALAHYHHGTDFSDVELEFAKKFALDNSLALTVDWCRQEQVGSKEKFWRDCRYKFFKSLDTPVATGANLDDAVEWYLMTSLRGRGEFMAYSHGNVIRPLLLVKKEKIVEYAKKHNLVWLHDDSNDNPEFTARNKIRQQILPKCFEVNPGLYTTVKKRIFEKEFTVEKDTQHK